MTYKDNYKTYIEITRPTIKSYNTKIYDSNTKFYSNRLSDKEKKKINSRYYRKKNPITIKELLLTILTFVILFLLILFNAKFQDDMIFYCFIILFFFIAVAFNYNVNTRFYIFFLILYFIIFAVVFNINLSYRNLTKNSKNNINNK